MAQKEWSKQEVARLTSLAPNKTVNQAAALLGRSVPAVRTKAQKLGIRLRKKYMTDSLCWECRHATNPEGKCPWSAGFQAVPGWAADRQMMRIGVSGEAVETYRIRVCPLFEEG